MVNKAIIVGNLGKAPELKYTSSGTAVCNFSVATTERYKDREGNKQEITTWHNIVVWRQLAEICGKYLQVGSKVYLEGKIQNRSYEDRDGVKKYISEIVVHDMQMLDSRSDNQSSQNENNNPTQQPPEQGWPDEPPF